MTAEPIRDMRSFSAAQSGELAMIEFHNTPPQPGATSRDQADSWLEGQSSAVERLRMKASASAREGQPVVVIHGESGSGKLRVAQWIHRCSRRSERPMMVLDGTASTIENQLERVVRNLSRDSDLTPGTVTIRNFHTLNSAAIQRLLEILTHQGPDQRCGLVLMTDREVNELRSVSLQHAQLLGRAGQAVIQVPSLRTRSGDISFLARRFVHEAARRYAKQVRGISPQALSRLESHGFPGNVHELRVLIEQAVLRSSGDWITAECFPGVGDNTPSRNTDQAEVVIRLPGSSLREIEVQALRLALRLSGGRIVRASELLGITRHALRRKLEKFGLNDLRQQFEIGGRPADLDPDDVVI